MKCILFTPLDAHASLGRVAALCATGHEIHLVDTSGKPLPKYCDIYPLSELRSIRTFSLDDENSQLLHASPNSVANHNSAYSFMRLGQKIMRLLSPSSKKITEMIILLNEITPTIVFTYYGPKAIQASRLIKFSCSHLPVVNILNLYPSSLDWNFPFNRIQRFVNAEHLIYARWVRQLDHIVCASARMQEHICDRFGVDRNRTSILPDYLPSTVYNSINNHEFSSRTNEPRVIYLGAPERWGGQIDALDGEFLALTKSNVIIASSQLSEEILSTGKGVKYERFTDAEVFHGRLAEYAHEFDAALVTYALNRRHERFRTTLPTRFFSAISAGVPIAVRGGIFDAVEDYVIEHNIGIIYSDSEDLRSKLANTVFLKQLRQNSIQHAKTHFAEAQANDIKQIIEKTIRNMK